MFIIILKKAGTNAWDYPDTPKFFKTNFVDRTDPENKKLIAQNDSGKTLEELTAQAGYPIEEYTGPIPDLGNYRKIVTSRELIELIGKTGFAEIVRAANITSASNDPEAVHFIYHTLDRAIQDELDVDDLTDVMNTFVASGYILTEDRDNVLRGYPA